MTDKLPPISSEWPHNWPEDYAPDRGEYLCKCYSCGAQFWGHKRRVVCKVCVSKKDSGPAMRTPEEPSRDVDQFDELEQRLEASPYVVFQEGERVRKRTGYKWPGIIVCKFKNLSMQTRYVVECTVPEVEGALHIFSQKDLEYDR